MFRIWVEERSEETGVFGANHLISDESKEVYTHLKVPDISMKDIRYKFFIGVKELTTQEQ